MTRLTTTATCNYHHNDVPFICFRSNAEESALINNLRVEALIGGCVPQLGECPSLCAEGTISRCREGAMLRCDSGSEDRRDRGEEWGGGSAVRVLQEDNILPLHGFVSCLHEEKNQLA